MNLRQIYEKLRQQAERNGQEINEGRLRQQAWMIRDRMMFEQSYVNNTISTSSAAGSGGGSIRRQPIVGEFSQSYIITWAESTDSIWKIAVFNYDSGVLSETINTELNFTDWSLNSSERNIQEGGFTIEFENNNDSTFKIFFINASGQVQGIKDLDTREDFQYTENAQGYLGELNSISTLYHFVNDGINTHQFNGIDINGIEIDDAGEDDVTKDGSMIVQDTIGNKYWIARPNGVLVDITTLLQGESDYLIDYNTDFIFARFSGDSLKAISQEGVLKNEIDLTGFEAIQIDTDTLFGENCGYYSFDYTVDNKLIVVYDGDYNTFVTATYSNNNYVYRTYTERSWSNYSSSFGKSLVISSWSQSSSNNIGSITDKVELKWLPKGKEEFNVQILEGLNMIFISGDEDYENRRTFTHGENPIIMFATESHIHVGFLTSDGFVSESTGILAASCSNIWGHNIGEKSFAVFDVDYMSDRIWQIYGQDSIEHEVITTESWSWGTSDYMDSNRNGTLAVIDSSNDASASNSFYYTPNTGVQSLDVNNGTIYNEITHGNRTGVASDAQIITREVVPGHAKSGNIEGFYLLTRDGLSDFVDLANLNSDYSVITTVVGNNIISFNLDKSNTNNRVIVYDKNNLQLIHDTGDIQPYLVEQYGDRVVIETKGGDEGEDSELLFIHKGGVENLSIDNLLSISYECNDVLDND